MSACSPLIMVNDLKSIKIIIKKPDKIILPVSAYPVPIEWAFDFKIP